MQKINSLFWFYIFAFHCMPDVTCLSHHWTQNRSLAQIPWIETQDPLDQNHWEDPLLHEQHREKHKSVLKKMARQFSSLFYANKIWFSTSLHLLLYWPAAQSKHCGKVTVTESVWAGSCIRVSLTWQNLLGSSIILMVPHCSYFGTIHGTKTQRRNKLKNPKQTSKTKQTGLDDLQSPFQP